MRHKSARRPRAAKHDWNHSRQGEPQPQQGHDPDLLGDRVLLRMPAAAQAVVRLRVFTQAYGGTLPADLSDLLDRQGPQNRRIRTTKLPMRTCACVRARLSAHMCMCVRACALCAHACVGACSYRCSQATSS
jgi:hypothetical protein